MILQTPITGSALRNALLAASLAAISAACVTPEQIEAQRIAEQQYQASIPTCASDKECQAKWSAARRWVLDNCGFKLQHVTDDYMETFNSGDYASPYMWCRVTKSPISETEYRIEVETGVNNPFAAAEAARSRYSFNNFVNTSWSPAR